jgi:hypothetical protein
LVFVVIFDFDLFQSKGVGLYGGFVDVGVSATELLVNFYVFQPVVAFHYGVMGEEVKHS